jgi:hypothetical protein
VVLVLLLAASLAMAPNARADESPGPGAGSTSPTLEQPTDAAQPADQDATTGQDAIAGATAAQPEQSNVLVVIRINSPGDNVVSQTNVVAVDAGAANRSSTTQARSPAASVLLASAIPVARAERTRPRAGGVQQSPPREAAPPAAGSGTAAQPKAGSPSAGAPHGRSAAVPEAGDRDHKQPPAASLRTSSRAAHQQAHAAKTAPQVDRGGRAAGASRLLRPQLRRDARGAAEPQLISLAEPAVAAPGRLPVALAAAPPSDGSDLGLVTLAALIAGLLGWAALAWLPRFRPLPRSGARA